MNTLLPVFFLGVCLFCACAPLPPKGPLPDVPRTRSTLSLSGKTFPDIPHDTRAGVYALKCTHGFYADMHIEESDLRHTHGNGVQPDPKCKGKIYTRYAMWWNGYYVAPEHWGYTFTIHTSKDDIISDCFATQQLLDKKASLTQ